MDRPLVAAGLVVVTLCVGSTASALVFTDELKVVPAKLKAHDNFGVAEHLSLVAGHGVYVTARSIAVGIPTGGKLERSLAKLDDAKVSLAATDSIELNRVRFKGLFSGGAPGTETRDLHHV